MRVASALVVLALVASACGDVGSSEVVEGLSADSAGPGTVADAQEDEVTETTQTPPPAGESEEQPSTTEPASTEPAGDDGDHPTTTDAPVGTLELNPVKETNPVAPVEGPPVGAADSLYPAGQIDSGMAPFIDMAIADLASQLGVDPAAITTISAVLVTWGDSSLGCPQPGMEYLQVVEDGSIIELGYGGAVYRYHSGGSRTPFLCNQPLATPPVVGGGADV